jgi:ribosomal protein S6
MKESKISYELVVVFNPKTEEKEKESLFAKLTTFLEGLNVIVAKKENVGVKELIYPLKGSAKGEFWSMDINSGKGVKLNDINLFLNREPVIIRYLILKK